MSVATLDGGAACALPVRDVAQWACAVAHVPTPGCGARGDMRYHVRRRVVLGWRRKGALQFSPRVPKQRW